MLELSWQGRVGVGQRKSSGEPSAWQKLAELGSEGSVLTFGLVSGSAVRVGVAADELEVSGARFGEVGVGEG